MRDLENGCSLRVFQKYAQGNTSSLMLSEANVTNDKYSPTSN